MIRSTLRFIIVIILTAGTYQNIGRFSRSAVVDLPPRESSELLVQESRFSLIRNQLALRGYLHGNIGFTTTREISSGTSTLDEDKKYYEAQYAMIPLILVRSRLDTPFVIGDFSGNQPMPEFPTTLTELVDAGNGLILFERKASP